MHAIHQILSNFGHNENISPNNENENINRESEVSDEKLSSVFCDEKLDVCCPHFRQYIYFKGQKNVCKILTEFGKPKTYCAQKPKKIQKTSSEFKTKNKI